MITNPLQSMEQMLVTSVAINKREAKITIEGVPDKPGVAGKIFRKLAAGDVNVDMIVQNVSHKTRKTDISFTVVAADLDVALTIVKPVAKRLGCGVVSTDEDIAKLSVVGLGMKSHSGVAAQMFEVLAKQKTNIEMISTSEIKISCIVRKSAADRAARALHSEFGLSGTR